MSDFPRIILGVSSTQIYKNTDDNNLNFYNNNINVISLDSSGNVGIGDTTPSYKLDVNGTGRFTSDLTIDANLIVHGTTVTMNTSTIQVEDPLIALASNNSADITDSGFYAQYNDGTTKYTGLFRDSSDSGKYKLFQELQDQPTTTVDTTGTGYSLADFECASINLTGNLTVDTDALVVNSSSNVGIGTNNVLAKLHVSGTTEEGLRIDLNHGSLTSNGIYFYNNGLSRFIVEGDGDCLNRNNTYTNISDRRLKKNIVEANNQWEDIKNIKFYNYNFVNEDTIKHIGVIAQQIQEVSPGLVKTSNSSEYVNGVLVKNIKTVKSSILYMKGMKTLQEAQIRIEELENYQINNDLVNKIQINTIKDLENNMINIKEDGLKEITFDRIKIEELKNNIINNEKNRLIKIEEIENNILENEAHLSEASAIAENRLIKIEELEKNGILKIEEIENNIINNEKNRLIKIEEIENNILENEAHLSEASVIAENRLIKIEELVKNEKNGILKIKELENNILKVETHSSETFAIAENNLKEIGHLRSASDQTSVIAENDRKKIEKLEEKSIISKKNSMFINNIINNKNKNKVFSESTFSKIVGTFQPIKIIDDMAYIQYMDNNNNIKQNSSETTPLYYGIGEESLKTYLNVYDKDTNRFLPTIYKKGRLVNDEIEIYNHLVNQGDIILVKFIIDNVKYEEEILVTEIMDTTHIKIDNTKLQKYFQYINNRNIFLYGTRQKTVNLLNEKFLYSLSSLSLSGLKELNNKVKSNNEGTLELINTEKQENNKQNIQIQSNTDNVNNIATKFNTLVQEHMVVKDLVQKSVETINKLLVENNNLKNTINKLNNEKELNTKNIVLLNGNFNKQNNINQNNLKLLNEHIKKQQIQLNQLMEKVNNVSL